MNLTLAIASVLEEDHSLSELLLDYMRNVLHSPVYLLEVMINGYRLDIVASRLHSYPFPLMADILCAFDLLSGLRFSYVVKQDGIIVMLKRLKEGYVERRHIKVPPSASLAGLAVQPFAKKILILESKGLRTSEELSSALFGALMAILKKNYGLEVDLELLGKGILSEEIVKEFRNEVLARL
ncbi:MAG: hypothetical protein DRN15_02760 [Thermoprotei archaeon]|nr:MAG: hypothetical protein DRN15_02760 [Thermoprotei archaeon]RLF25357.1 MAG: hypothetical protein DRM97_02080 [Thermoprotei archaeon]